MTQRALSDLASHAEQIPSQENDIKTLQGMIDRGEGTPTEIGNAKAQIEKTQGAIAQAKQADATAIRFISQLKSRNARIEELLK